MTTPTLASIQQTLLDNADYSVEGSVAKAKAFVTAATQMLIVLPQSSANQATSVAYSVDQIRQLKNEAEEWLAANDPVQNASSSTRFLSVEGFRK